MLFRSASPVNFCTKPGERPVATALARLQAGRQKHVTNLRHDTTELSELQRLVLRHLDGEHDRAALVEVLRGLAREGKLVLQAEVQRDPARTTAALEQALETALADLARRALVVG